MATSIQSSSRLLSLPNEIKLQIWEYAFGHTHLPVFSWNRSEWGDDPLECEGCAGNSPSPSHNVQLMYEESLNRLLVCKEIYSQAAVIFRSTLTLHVRDSEALALVRRNAPQALRTAVQRLVLYVHFNRGNHFQWCLRLFELHVSLPALKHMCLEYHMRPPISYDNLLDVVYFYIPLLSLQQPFNPPRHIVKTEDRPVSSLTTTETTPHLTFPCTDSTPGMIFHTAYIRNETLFEADFLGSITTDDAIDEHTSVVRDLFHDPTFIATATRVVESNRTAIDNWVNASFKADHFPQKIIEDGFPNTMYLPALQHALLQIARRHERPWFEKLQRKRIIDVFEQQGRMTRPEAEALLTRQLASLPEGHGIEEFLERLMMQTDENVENLAELFGMSDEGEWPASWTQS